MESRAPGSSNANDSSPAQTYSSSDNMRDFLKVLQQYEQKFESPLPQPEAKPDAHRDPVDIFRTFNYVEGFGRNVDETLLHAEVIDKDQVLANKLHQALSSLARRSDSALQELLPDTYIRCAVREMVILDSQITSEQSNVLEIPFENRRDMLLLHEIFESYREPNQAEIELLAMMCSSDDQELMQDWFDEMQGSTQQLHVIRQRIALFQQLMAGNVKRLLEQEEQSQDNQEKLQEGM